MYSIQDIVKTSNKIAGFYVSENRQSKGVESRTKVYMSREKVNRLVKAGIEFNAVEFNKKTGKIEYDKRHLEELDIFDNELEAYDGAVLSNRTHSLEKYITRSLYEMDTDNVFSIHLTQPMKVSGQDTDRIALIERANNSITSIRAFGSLGDYVILERDIQKIAKKLNLKTVTHEYYELFTNSDYNTYKNCPELFIKSTPALELPVGTELVYIGTYKNYGGTQHRDQVIEGLNEIEYSGLSPETTEDELKQHYADIEDSGYIVAHLDTYHRFVAIIKSNDKYNYLVIAATPESLNDYTGKFTGNCLAPFVGRVKMADKNKIAILGSNY